MSDSLAIYSIFLILVLGTGCFMLIKWRRKQTEEHTRLLIERETLEEQARQMQQLISVTKNYREEITRQIESLGEDIDYSEYVQTLGEIREELENIPSQQFCENILIQALLAHKQIECQRKEIQLEIEVPGLDKLAISDFNLISILYNLFDNAVEACEKLTEPESRRIKISTETRKRYLLLTFENTCQAALPRKDPFETWKSNPEEHGLGLGIIRELTMESRGTVRFMRNEKSFLAELKLPLKKAA